MVPTLPTTTTNHPSMPSHRHTALSSSSPLQIWDLQTKTLQYRSSVLGASPLRVVASHPQFDRFAVGAANGVLRTFEHAATPRLVHEVDIDAVLRRRGVTAATARRCCILSVRYAVVQEEEEEEDEDGEGDSDDAAAFFVKQPTGARQWR